MFHREFDNDTFSRIQFSSTRDPKKRSSSISGLIDPISRLVRDQYLACLEQAANGDDYYALRNIAAAHHKKPEKCIRIRVYPECLRTDLVFKEFKTRVEAALLVRCYQPGGDYSIFGKV